MKIIDVCDNYAGGGCLKQYYERNNISDYKIICMGLNLAVGDIKNDHLTFIRKLYKDNSYDYNDSINELLDSINGNTKIRIWSSKGNDDAYLLLLYACNLLKDICDNISVVYTTDYNKYILSISTLHYSEINHILKYEQQLSKDEIKNYSIEWGHLVEINSDLRVLIDGSIINKNFSDYDEIILNKLKKLGRCKLANLVGNLMGDHAINDSGDAVYGYLIDRLITQNKIKVIDKGQRHFSDIIEFVEK